MPPLFCAWRPLFHNRINPLGQAKWLKRVSPNSPCIRRKSTYTSSFVKNRGQRFGKSNFLYVNSIISPLPLGYHSTREREIIARLKLTSPILQSLSRTNPNISCWYRAYCLSRLSEAYYYLHLWILLFSCGSKTHSSRKESTVGYVHKT
ncbi:hypothetical protein Golomagni_06138 [Golovinomyces magnicellulatus]|nr:hypothetical protein Golomagni_06138 [Golovinomyces magnicellulatus]